jgi:hypothetical protein
MAAGAIVIYVFAYGLPVLALREIAARTGAGWPGLLVMGLGYGLVNEGLYARTIFRETGLPLPVFDGMPLVFGVNLAFAAFLLSWHALSSVVLPIALTEGLWPGRHRHWLGRRGLIATGVVAAAAASAFFALTDPPLPPGAAPVPQPGAAAFAGLWAAIAALVWLGSRIAARPGPLPAFGPAAAFLLGLAGVIPFFLSVLPAEAGGPLWLSLGALALCVAAYGAAAARLTGGGTRLLGWFGAGWYAMTAGFSAVQLVQGSPAAALASIVVLGGVFLIVARAKDQT